MNRRGFFQATGATALALSLPLSLQAETRHKQVFIDGAIAANHGHAVSLSIAQVVELFAMTHQMGPQSISIQGQSGHPHRITLDQDLLVQLLNDQELEMESSTDAGHSHGVVISLEVLEV